MVTKTELEIILKKWLSDFLFKKYPNHEIEILIPSRALSNLENPKLKRLQKISFFDFRPDILGILTTKNSNNTELVFLNREIRTWGLKDIGVMLLYCKISKPLHAFMASIQGLAPQIDRIINHHKRHELITYNGERIKIFRWDLASACIDELSITPLEAREFFE